jgi:hypothetical protein
MSDNQPNQSESSSPASPCWACPSCGSTAIGHLRLDCDWGSGGDWTPANDASCYSTEQRKAFDNNERPDVDCYICCKCASCFDAPNAQITGPAPVTQPDENTPDAGSGVSTCSTAITPHNKEIQ